MAYDRTGTGRWWWVKTVGSADSPLQENWAEEHAHLLEKIYFPKYPRSLRGGDLLVYYAADHRDFPAVVELVNDQVDEDDSHPDHSKRWPWTMKVRPRLVIPQLSDAPTLDDVGFDPLRLRRQSHIRLTVEQADRIRDVFLPPTERARAAAA